MNFRALQDITKKRKKKKKAVGFEAIIQVLQNIWSSHLLGAHLLLACMICVKALHLQQCDVILSLHLPPGHVFLTLLPLNSCPPLLSCSQLTCLKIKALLVARHWNESQCAALRAEVWDRQWQELWEALTSAGTTPGTTWRVPEKRPALALSTCSTICCILFCCFGPG